MANAPTIHFETCVTQAAKTLHAGAWFSRQPPAGSTLAETAAVRGGYLTKSTLSISKWKQPVNGGGRRSPPQAAHLAKS